MSYEVNLTPQAMLDLEQLYRYIAVELQSAQNAAAQLGRLEARIYALDELPERFRLYEHEPWRSRNLRVMPVDRYLVFYLTDRETNTVTVLRVLYGGRDVAAQLGL